MRLEDILLEFGKLQNLSPFLLNEKGICHLTINDTLIVSIEKSINEQEFYLYSTVGQVISEKEKKVALMALSGNLFGKETGHAILGYSPETNSLVLFERFDEETTDFRSFCHHFNDFLNYLTYWTSKLEAVEKVN